MTAYGYIRKSVVHDPARMLSPEMQEEAIRRLATANGDEDVIILSDLDVSGRKGRGARPGWDELLRAVEEGEAKSVYAYSLSRFARSVSQLADFFELCDRQKVRIRVDRDHIDTSTATGKLVGNVLASLAQFEADVASERVKDAFAAKRARDPEWQGPGHRRYGSQEGEDASVVVDAFREAESFDGAARILNALGVPTRVKGRAWSGSVVHGIVRENAPDLVPPIVRRGSKAGIRSFRLSNLVECSTCKAAGRPAFLTGSRDTRRGDVRYACSRARVIPHVRGWVNESKLMPVIIEEAEHATARVRRMQKGTAEDEAALAVLAAKRTRVIENYEDGLIDKANRDAKLAAIAADESKLSAVRWIKRIALPPDLEEDDPAKVNSYLRRIFTTATVDMSQPALRGPSSWVPTVEFEWRDPAMRVA